MVTTTRTLMAAAALLAGIQPTAFAQGPASPPAKRLAHFVTLGAPLVTIGKENTEGPELFGDITAVAMDPAGRTYILDRTAHQVRAFDRDGRFLSAAGQAGRGPADLGWPLSMFHDGRSGLYVLDALNGVVEFETTGGTLAYRRTFAAQFQPSGGCRLGDAFILPGWRDKRILHLFDLRGQALRSFGESFSPDSNPAVREVFSQIPLRIRCDEAHNRIYVAPSAAPFVRAYDLNGRLVWQNLLPGYNGHEIVQTPQGIVTFYGTFATTGLVRLGDDYLLVQARERAPAASARDSRSGRGTWRDKAVVTYVLSARTGNILARVTDAPLIAAVQDNTAIAFSQEPYPRVWRIAVAPVPR